jgi:coenzyme PQQ precursor peptide PqqA
MKWTKPEFKEISLSMEVTAYANTDASVNASSLPKPASAPATRDGARRNSAE